jgi:hypothetical protein
VPVHGILSAATEFYLVFTLVATSLAKLRRWRGSSLAIIRERVIPVGLAPVVIIGVAVAELAISTLIVLGSGAFTVGCVTVAMFGVFGAYRLMAAVKTKSVECTCAGTTEYSPATPQSVAAMVATCLFQIGLAVFWTLSASHGITREATLAGVAAWILPFGVLLIGGFARPRLQARLQTRLKNRDRPKRDEAVPGSINIYPAS